MAHSRLLYLLPTDCRQQDKRPIEQEMEVWGREGSEVAIVGVIAFS